MDNDNLGKLASAILHLDNARAYRRISRLVKAEKTMGIKPKSESRHKLTGSNPCDCTACKAVLYRQAKQSGQFMGRMRIPGRDLVVG